MTPDPEVNRGALWAKANMLRVEPLAPTGWCFVNDPAKTNNSVARDTAWFAFGADFVTPDFVRESLLKYVELMERRGMVVEYYDIRTAKTADYKLNINDNTPLIVLALWHHYNATGDVSFLRRVYRASKRAAEYILSQRNEQGTGVVHRHRDRRLGDRGMAQRHRGLPNQRRDHRAATPNATQRCAP